jgi:hypothetical protein
MVGWQGRDRRRTSTDVIASLGRIPKRLLLDNFAVHVAGPDPLNPRMTRGFLEYSQERGFLCDPAKVRKL